MAVLPGLVTDRDDEAAFRIAEASPDRRSTPSSALLAVAAAGRALMTRAVPTGSDPNCSRTRGRRRRVTRCRTTELPTFAETTNPARGGTSCRVGSRWMTKRRVPARRPPLTTAAKSAPVRRRASADSTMRRSVAVGRNSGRDLVAALATTRGENRATGAGAHAQTEAVDLGPTAVVRLKGALAHGDLSRSEKLRDYLLRRLQRTARPDGDVPPNCNAVHHQAYRRAGRSRWTCSAWPHRSTG